MPACEPFLPPLLAAFGREPGGVARWFVSLSVSSLRRLDAFLSGAAVPFFLTAMVAGAGRFFVLEGGIGVGVAGLGFSFLPGFGRGEGRMRVGPSTE